MASGANCCVTFVVYLLVFCNIVGGILFLVGRNYQSPQDDYSTSSAPSGSEIATGIISICLGLLLLYGAVKKHAGCVLVYLVLMIIGAVIRTAMIIYVLVSFGSSLGGYAVLIVVLLVILWAMVYCVYLFFKSLGEQSNVSSTSFDTDPPYYKEVEEMA